MSEETSNDTPHEKTENTPRHLPRVRDVWTNRVIGWATGALIPILLLLIPLATRWMDDAKELEKLRITGSIEQIAIIKESLLNLKSRVSYLEEELTRCQNTCQKISAIIPKGSK